MGLKTLLSFRVQSPIQDTQQLEHLLVQESIANCVFYPLQEVVANSPVSSCKTLGLVSSPACGGSGSPKARRWGQKETPRMNWKKEDTAKLLAAKAWIFTSIHSVHFLFEHILPKNFSQHLEGKQFYAIGSKTKAKLAHYTQREVHCPALASSEGFVKDFFELHTSSQKTSFALIQGSRARNHIANFLEVQGHEVVIFDVYQRQNIELEGKNLFQQLNNSDAMLFTNGESLEIFFKLYEKQGKCLCDLQDIFAFFPSQRVAELTSLRFLVSGYSLLDLSDPQASMQQIKRSLYSKTT